MSKLNFTSFPVIKTERLILRQLTKSDAEMVYALRTNIEVLKFIDRTPTKSIKEGQEFVKRIAKSVKDNTVIYWAIALKDSPKLIGSICFLEFF